MTDPRLEKLIEFAKLVRDINNCNEGIFGRGPDHLNECLHCGAKDALRKPRKAKEGP